MAREYTKTPNSTRLKLLKLIASGMMIKDAAYKLKVNYENAKAINRVWKKEERIEKLITRTRLPSAK